ncbi:MAG: winged helix-turn-helix domain-containing protein [Acidobacteria bacterium]|nr:winged helix-turn-helix domain-containing protein [Acidobacteriota bacterium]
MTLFLATSRQAGLRCLQILALTDVAALHLIEGNVEDAEALLDEARARVRGTVVRFCDTQIAGLETAIAFGRGQETLARTSLARTLALAETQGTCGCLMWIRSGFSALFSEAWRSGVRPNVIRVLVRRYEVPPPTPFTDPWPWPVRIRAFGAMTIEVDERPLIADGKAQHRVLDLLRLLIAESGRNVSAQRISDALWPDTEGDGAMTNVRGTVKRLRDLLGDADLVRMYDGKVSLNHRMVWLDTWALGELCESVETDAVADATVLEHRLFSLYREPLLAADDHAWLIDGRRRQRERFARCVTTLMRRRANAGDIEHALMLCDRALGIDAQLPDALKRVRDSLLQRLTSHVPTQAIPKGPTRLH